MWYVAERMVITILLTIIVIMDCNLKPCPTYIDLSQYLLYKENGIKADVAQKECASSS